MVSGEDVVKQSMMSKRFSLIVTGVCALPLMGASTAGAAGFHARQTIAVQVKPSPARTATLTPGQHIDVRISGAALRRSQAYCLGLVSMIDRYSLPVNLGRVVVAPSGAGSVSTSIPANLLPAEPAGPFMLFVGACTSIAPDRPFVATTTVRIVRA